MKLDIMNNTKFKVGDLVKANKTYKKFLNGGLVELDDPIVITLVPAFVYNLYYTGFNLYTYSERLYGEDEIDFYEENE